MTTNPNSPSMLPKKVQANLEKYCEEIGTALANDLVAIVLYGDSVSVDSFNAALDPVNVMIVVKRVNVALLDRIHKPTRNAARRIRLVPMILSEDDLRGSTDVFPIKFLRMQREHCLLRGSDVLASLDVSRDHLRLRCEQELKNLMLRMRQGYLDTADQPKRFQEMLNWEIRSCMNGLSAALLLTLGDAPKTNSEIVAAAAKQFELDADCLNELLAVHRGEFNPKADAMKSLYDRFMQTVQRMAETVDRW